MEVCAPGAAFQESSGTYISSNELVQGSNNHNNDRLLSEPAMMKPEEAEETAIEPTLPDVARSGIVYEYICQVRGSINNNNIYTQGWFWIELEDSRSSQIIYCYDGKQSVNSLWGFVKSSYLSES